MVVESLEQRVMAYVSDPEAAGFGALALAIFEEQFRTLAALRRRCTELGKTPDSITDWRQIPALEPAELATLSSPGPAPAFREALVRAAMPELARAGSRNLVIEAEGESGGGDALLETAVRMTSEADCVARGGRLDAKQLRSWFGARQRDRAPVTIVAAPPGLEKLVGVLERRAVKFRLPPGSAAFCVLPLAAAARSTESDGSSWSARLEQCLGLPQPACRRVLTRSMFSTPLVEGGAMHRGRFRLPHWVRVEALDSTNVAFCDLASVDTCLRRREQAPGGVEIEEGPEARFLVFG